MNINASIIDQQVRSLAEKQRQGMEEALGRTLDDTLRRSAAFVLLSVRTLLDLSDTEALDRLTEGGNDFGVDAMDVTRPIEGESKHMSSLCILRAHDGFPLA